MCSLYSINNNSKVAGQSSFQVVLCPRSNNNTNNNNHSNNNNHHHSLPSSPSSGSPWSTACSHSRGKKMKGATVSNEGPAPVLVLSSQGYTTPYSPSSPHYPPLTRSPPAQSAYQQSHTQRRSRHGHVNHGASHWQQFHQHHRLHSFDASFEQEHERTQAQHSISPQKRASTSPNDHRSFANFRDAETCHSSQILNPTNRVQIHSKSLSQPCSPSQSTPAPSGLCYPSLSSPQRKLAYPTAAPATTSSSRSIDTSAISFAAAVAAAGASPSKSAPALLRSQVADAFCGPQSLPATDPTRLVHHQKNLTRALRCDDTITRGSVAVAHRSRSTDAVDDPLSRIGTSVDSVDNVAFDGDDMDLNHSTDSIDATDSDSSMADAEASVRPLAAHLLLRSESGKLERKSRLKRKIDRLRAKNATLKSTVTQIKSDLALERQKRSTMDQIYLSIKKDLNLKLEAEETKVLSLKAEIEQMAAEMKDMKERLASTSVSVEADDKASSRYKIEYDSSTYSLSNGITSIGGLIMSCHANLDLIDGQDDSEEFLRSTHLFPSSALQGSSKSLRDSTFATTSSDDDDMDDEDQSDDDDGPGDVVSALFSQTPLLVTSASSQRGSVTSPSSLPGLVEEEESEDMEESDEDPTDDSTPRTMMEIILQRQRTRSPEDDVKDPPADANETFETMAQKALFHAIRSKFTVAQAHLQLEELIVKYDARLEQAVDVIAKEVSQWWEDERVATGGPISGGWGVEDVVIDRETGEQGSPKTALERRVNSFFGPLLLQFVASLREQKMLLEKLETYAKADTRWMKNHNAVLVALYKFDVVESEAVLEWWQGLTEPQGVFGHGGDNLRSLSAKFVAWLEDEEDDSDSEDDDEDSDADSSCVDDDDSDDDLEDADEDVMEQDEETMLETILDLAFPAEDNSNSSSNVGKDKDMPQESLLAESKRKISFCTNNMYYSQDGKAFCREDATAAGDLDTDEGAVKKHV